MKIIISLVPVLLFLGLLLSLDSFRLTNWWVLITCLLWGGVTAGLSLMANMLMAEPFHLNFTLISRYIAPFFEEVVKLTLLLFLISRHRIGFAIDAAIYGFAVGSGFAFSENLIYLLQQEPGYSNPLIWIIRGFGTAIMHGGATATGGVILVNRFTTHRKILQPLLLAILITYLIHALYNAFYISPLLSVLLMILLIPGALVIVFTQGEHTVRNWLDMGLDTEVKLLTMIKEGKLAKTAAGHYLHSVNKLFPGDVAGEMYRYLTLYLELSVKAKGRMLLREQELPIPVDPQIPGKLKELDRLHRKIGPSGLLALQPILRMGRSDLWALASLNHR